MADQMPAGLAETLRAFDSREDIFTLAEVYDAVLKFSKQCGELPPEEDCALRAEYFAYFLIPPGARGSDWGTYFGPILGPFNIKNIPAEVVSYWIARMDEVTHPVLKAHYADLVWDLSRPLASTKPPIRAAQEAIDAYLAATNRWKGDPIIHAVHWAERALQLALSINDSERTEAAKRAMFDLSDRFFKPRDVNTWYFLFDCLLDKPRPGLTPSEGKSVVDRLEEALHATLPDIWVAQAAGERLARYYRRTRANGDVLRVARTYGLAFEQAAADLDPLRAMPLLERAYEAYCTYGLAEEARHTQLKLKEKGLVSHQSMATVSVPVEVSPEAWEAYIERLITGPLDDALARLAWRFVPDTDGARDALRWMQTDTPLLAILPVSLIADGNVVATAGSVEEDPDGRLRWQITETLGMETPFLGAVIDRLRERHALTVGHVVDFLAQSPAFDEPRIRIVSEGLAAYFSGDHVKAAHVLVPQIEAALRTLLGLIGEPTNKPVPREPGVMQEKNIADVLSNERLATVVPENVRLYLSVFLADRRGRNVRNRLSHGLLTLDEFGRALTDRLLHVLLVIALFREEAVGGTSEGDADAGG